MPRIKSRNWTKQEDEHLSEIIKSTDQKQAQKPTWNEISDLLQKKCFDSNKTGKQCRQRWINHLSPEVKKNIKWTVQQNKILFSLHNKLGNKWSQIAKNLNGRTDNCIKNHFYSTLRRGMRKINHYIQTVKRKQVLVKTFKNEILNKILLLSQSQGKYDQKFQFTPKAKELSVQIKQILISLAIQEDIQEEQIVEKKSQEAKKNNQQLEARGYEMICEFSRNCRKKKGKRYIEQDIMMSQQSEQIKQSDSEINHSYRGKQKKKQKAKPKQMGQVTDRNAENIYDQQQIQEDPVQKQKKVQTHQSIPDPITILLSKNSLKQVHTQMYSLALQTYQKSDLDSTKNAMNNSSNYQTRNIAEGMPNNWFNISNIQNDGKFSKLLNENPFPGKQSHKNSLLSWGQRLKDQQIGQNLNFELQKLCNQGVFQRLKAEKSQNKEQKQKRQNIEQFDEKISNQFQDEMDQELYLPLFPLENQNYEKKRNSLMEQLCQQSELQQLDYEKPEPTNLNYLYIQKSYAKKK